MGRALYTTRSFLQLLCNDNSTKIIHRQKISTSEVSCRQSVSNREQEEARPRASNKMVPECIRFQEVLEMHREGIISRKSGAAVVAEMPRSTLVHRVQGRRSAEDYHKSRRLLKEEKEEILIWYCNIL